MIVKNPLNMEDLALWHVENMSNDDLMGFAQFYLCDLYERDDEMFRDDWRWMEDHKTNEEAEEWDTQP